MSQDQIQIILDRLDKMDIERSEKHELLMTQIQELKEKINPVVDVYSNVVGTTKVMKYIFVGISFIVGFILSIKALYNK